MENNELDIYRKNLLDQIESMAARFHDACLKVKDVDAPLEADGWNAHQVAAHTRDVQLAAYGMRVRRTIEENDPLFQNFDGDAYNKEHYRADEPMQHIVDEFLNDVRALLAQLRALPNTAWSRSSHHVTYGERSLQTWTELLLAHIKEHLESVEKAGK